MQGSTRQEYPLDLDQKREEAKKDISESGRKLLDELRSDATLGLSSFKPSLYLQSADELVSGGKAPATLPGFKEVESFAKKKGLNPEVLMEWCRNLSGKAKLGEWNRKFPNESKGWKVRIEQEVKFIENTRELANFSNPPYPMVGRSVVTPFLTPKWIFFLQNHRFSSFRPTALGPRSCPAVFPEIFARPFTLWRMTESI